MTTRRISALDGFSEEFLEAPAGILDVKKLVPLVAEWRRRYRFRADLKRLLRAGPHLTEDIGLAPGDARRESEKPFWTP